MACSASSDLFQESTQCHFISEERYYKVINAQMLLIIRVFVWEKKKLFGDE